MAVANQEQFTISPANRLAEKIKIRRDYVHGKGSINALADLYAVPYQTVMVWAAEEKWTRLKANHDKAELAKLSQEPSQYQNGNGKANSESVTEQQLHSVNQAMLSCDDAGELDKLTRAKLGLLEALHYERTGCRIPSSRQVKPSSRRSAPSIQDQPEPVQVQATPAPTLPATLPSVTGPVQSSTEQPSQPGQ